MADSEKFEHYVSQVLKLADHAVKDPQALKEILLLIDLELKASEGVKPDEDFFRGEYAFYNKEYDHALKAYLLARTIPQFQFYCYRTSAYISKEREQDDKALSFAKKALSIFPEDPFTKALIGTLTSSSPSKVAIGKKEMEELAHIFQGNPEQKEELFAHEFEPLRTSQTARTESSMNMDFFSSTNGRDPTIAEELSSRLYPTATAISKPEPTVLLAELKKMTASEPIAETKRFSAPSLPANTYDDALESQIQTFKEAQTNLLIKYFEEGKTRPQLPDFCLHVLHGWQPNEIKKNIDFAASALLTDQMRQATGGYFLRWNGKGIVINPGENFLKNFHSKGLHIKDIDFVIVTRNTPETYADVKEIYHLNMQLNKLSSEFQLIYYYLNPKAYQDLSSTLKPNFKQERHTVLPLELFIDSPDVEKIELAPDITLHYFSNAKQEAYFQTASPDSVNHKYPSSLGIKLELKSSHSTVKLGYLSGTGWSPLLSHYLGTCDILIAQFGNTSSADYNKNKYNESSLGYFGTYTLLEDVRPKILLCTEFGGQEGDIRLEAIQKMRHEHRQSKLQGRIGSISLPGDNGLFLDLKTLQARCNLTHMLVDPQQIKVVKSTDAFGQLHYLSPHCLI